MAAAALRHVRAPLRPTFQDERIGRNCISLNSALIFVSFPGGQMNEKKRVVPYSFTINTVANLCIFPRYLLLKVFFEYIYLFFVKFVLFSLSGDC